MRRVQQHGFTLVELMIAMIAGAFAVAGVYYLNGVSSRSFAEQVRISDTQMSLRSAMEQLRRDFSRAGYLATPNSDRAPDCLGATTPAPSNVAATRVRALGITYNGSAGDTNVNAFVLPTTNNTRVDTVDTWGNYATAEAYLLKPVGSSKTELYLQADSESFRRSFFYVQSDGTTAFNEAVFKATFAGRTVRVENDGRYFFRKVASVNSSPNVNSLVQSSWPSILFTSSLPECFSATSWAAISPIVHMQYTVLPDDAPGLTRLRATSTVNKTNVPGARRAILVRQEVDDSAPAVLANTITPILDYAVEFSVDAYINNNADLTLPPVWALTRNVNLANISANSPERFRSLIVTLSARSAEVDPKTPAPVNARTFNNANLLDSPLMFVQVGDPDYTARALYTRARTLRSEIFLQNL